MEKCFHKVKQFKLNAFKKKQIVISIFAREGCELLIKYEPHYYLANLKQNELPYQAILF